MTGRRILLVDDDHVFSNTLAGALGRRGYGVDTAATLEDALALASAQQFDCILLDLMLGEQSTLNHIEALLADQRDAKLVMLTGYASIPTTVRALKLGATDYLAKPVGLKEVLTAIESDGGADTAPEDEELKPLPLKRLEWEHIQRVLSEHDGNLSAAARALGMHRRSLQRKLAKRPPPA